MPFADFIKTTVLLCAASATTLALVTILGAASEHDATAATFPFYWWAAAGVIGATLGARDRMLGPIARLLASARAVTQLPEPRPGLIMLTRLWPLLLLTLVACLLSIVAPQISGVAAGFPLISALAWRHQYRAVLAIEGRDGVRFHVERGSFWRALKLTRTPGFKVYRPTL